MTQEDKELLIKDLCARLPYGVKFMCNKNIYTTKGLDLIVTDEGDWEYAATAKGTAPIEIDFIKPYLFPLSSMTEEQERELIALTGYKSECEAYYGFDSMGYYIKAVGEFEYEEGEHSFMFYPDYVGIDWFNKNHFDYRGLIEKGLAIDATGLNIY